MRCLIRSTGCLERCDRRTVFRRNQKLLYGLLMQVSATAVKDLLTAEVVPLDEKGSSLKLVRAGQDVTSSFPHRLLYNVGTFSTYFECSVVAYKWAQQGYNAYCKEVN